MCLSPLDNLPDIQDSTRSLLETTEYTVFGHRAPFHDPYRGTLPQNWLVVPSQQRSESLAEADGRFINEGTIMPAVGGNPVDWFGVKDNSGPGNNGGLEASRNAFSPCASAWLTPSRNLFLPQQEPSDHQGLPSSQLGGPGFQSFKVRLRKELDMDDVRGFAFSPDSLFHD